MIRLARLAVLVLAVGVGFEAWAEDKDFHVEPGQWEFETMSQPPMAAAPTTKVSTDCVEDGEMSPERLTAGMPDCVVSDIVSNPEKMSWTMVCPTPMGEMQGTGEFKSTGETLTGSLILNVALDGQPVKIENSWKGKRIGPCAAGE
jgi:hypothetical protein